MNAGDDVEGREMMQTLVIAMRIGRVTIKEKGAVLQARRP